MGGNGEVRTDGLTPKVGYVIGDARVKSAKEIKAQVSDELQRLLQSGQITKEEAKAAMKYLDKNLAAALARGYQVERTCYETLYGFDDLEDEKADALMKEVGLTIGDLYDASKFAGADYEVSYTHLSRKERKMAENGEVTSSELKNIQNSLNEKIKANGGDRVLSEKETKQLMKGLGLSVESKFNPIRIILSALGLGAPAAALTSSGAAKATVTVVATDGTAVSATASTAAKGIGFVGGLAGGVVIGAGAEMLHEAFRKEKPYGEQGGSEGGRGSVTNKTEAKMKRIGELQTEVMETGDYPLPDPPSSDPFEEFFKK